MMGGGTPGAAMGGGIIAGLSKTSDIVHSMLQNERQRDLVRSLAKNKYQWMMGDLQKAGINPIWAFGGSAQAGASAGGMIGAPSGPDIMSSARSAALLRQDVRQARNLADASEFKPAQAAAEVRLTNARAAMAAAEVPRAAAKERLLGDVFDEATSAYEAQGGIRGMLEVNPKLKEAWKWLSEEYREGRTPLQRMRKPARKKPAQGGRGARRKLQYKRSEHEPWIVRQRRKNRGR